MTELNPNHPVTAKIRDYWQNVVATLVAKAGGHVIITLGDLDQVDPNCLLTIQELRDGIHLRLVSAEEGQRLARKEGGLPT